MFGCCSISIFDTDEVEQEACSISRGETERRDGVYNLIQKELCRQSKETIFITKNGYSELVVMSMEIYEKSLAKLKLYQKLALAEEQIQNGEEVFKNLKEKHERC